MKVIRLLFAVISIFTLNGCWSDSTRNFMQGTYVNSAGGEFSIASDTLVVEQVEGNNYVIHRRTGYNLIADGKIGIREHETEEWSCLYDPERQTLLEKRKGKIISFFPEKSALTIGRRVYKKLN